MVNCNKIVKFGWDKINNYITGDFVQNQPNNWWFSAKKSQKENQKICLKSFMFELVGKRLDILMYIVTS